MQRWEERGTGLMLSELEPLARALAPVRPDLAEKLASSAGTSLGALGIDPAALAKSRATMSDPVGSVVHAAAKVMGVSPDAIRPALAAAFARAAEAGLDVQKVVKGLSAQDPTHFGKPNLNAIDE
jgi:hypothetical protein